MTRLIPSLGAGAWLGPWRADVAVSYVALLPRQIEAREGRLGGQFTGQAFALTLGLSWTPGASAPY